MLVTSDPSVRFMTKMEIIDNILLLLFAAHDTSRSVLSLVMKYLGQLPQVFEHVLKEQLEISQGKEAGQLLQLEDVQKMKYSWNVASEVMRLSLPVSGAYREAKEDFTYADYNIPKGWNLARSLDAIVLTLRGNLDVAALKLARNLSAAPIGSLDIIITFALAKPSLSQLLRFLQEPITTPPCC
ncbi:Beta-amyrin 28-monooxygenase [Glycine soja]|uniref:Beta-amyrin 28-monooxygenase n=1 Tax=Glycine soja TaxID=3848 RepID=A0A445JKX4_GLYSO|nr:Beta-amyrin 28-monooxygenase [Glycine soja]